MVNDVCMYCMYVIIQSYTFNSTAGQSPTEVCVTLCCLIRPKTFTVDHCVTCNPFETPDSKALSYMRKIGFLAASKGTFAVFSLSQLS